MDNRRAVFFDIDGTLSAHKTQKIPESTRNALQELRKKGHLTFINTGRTFVNIPQTIRELGFDGYICGCGSAVYFQEENILHSKISHEECSRIVKRIRELKIPAFFEGNDRIYFDRYTEGMHPLMGYLKKEFKEFCEEFVEGSGVCFDKYYCMMNPESDMDGLMEFCQDRYECIIQPGPCVEVIQKGYSKATGIEYVCKKLGISIEDCYAVGDSDNDLPMLQAVPNSIAMGECSEAVRKCCGYQTDRLEDDGIWKAMKHFALI